MTIALSANTPRISYTVAEGVTRTTPFNTDFIFFETSDISVFVDGVARTFDASTANTTQFTVSGGNGSTGSVTTHVTGATGGSTVVITRDIELKRTTDFPSSGAFEISKLNTELDTIIAITSDFNDEASRAIRLQDFDDAVAMTLPLKDARKGKVLGFNATTGAVEAGPTITAVQSLADVTASINLLGTSAVVEDMGLLATSAVIEDMGLLATSSNIANMATLSASGVIADIATVAGKASLITSAFSSGMSLVTSDFVSDVNTLAVTDVINDINTLATSDIVSDLNTLATTDIVSDLNTLATTDIVSDLNTLATSDVIADINLLATTDVVSDLALLATSDFVSDLNTLATSTNVTNIATVATNVTGVNSFAERYRVASSDPTSNNDAGDLYFNTADNELKAYNGSSWQTTAISSALATNISIVAGEITAQEDLGSITESIDTSSGNNIDTVANAITNINTVAGANANISALAASDVIADMALLATTDVIADMALLANTDVIADMNTLATTDIVSDLNTLATSDIVSDLNTLATSDIVSDINTLATSDIVSDLNTLATSDIVTDLNILATSANVTNMATLGASGVVGNIATVAGVQSEVSTVAGIASNVTTVANNLSSINNFEARYRVASSEPTTSLDEGDLYYNTTTNRLNFYNGSSFEAIVAGAMTDVVDDTTPQLGGNLDVNGNSIVSVSNGDITIAPNGAGEINLNGTVNTDNLIMDFGSIA